MRILAFVGLPGSGKSTLARALAAELGATIFDKDEWRARMFAAGEVEYSRAQDELVMARIHGEVEKLASEGRTRDVVLDGRTYSRAEQVVALRALAQRCGAELVLIECVCAQEVAAERLARDRALGTHPAANRGPELLTRLAAEAEPISGPKYVLATDSEPPERSLARLRELLARV
ncbi:MAG: ATP-binding protein [Planctomycetota bacterium]